MLIHKCVECGGLSINRIAADDDPDSVMDVFRASLTLGMRVLAEYQGRGFAVLKDAEIVSVQLYGRDAKIPAIGWT